MGILSSRVRRLCAELKGYLLAGPPSRSTLNALNDRVGKLFCSVLRDDDHPFSKKLEELRDAVILTRKEFPSSKLERKSATAKNFDRLYFVAQPGCFDNYLRSFWPLQLLLMVAASSKHAPWIAERLGIPLARLPRAIKDAGSGSFGMWSKTQYLQNLSLALEQLDYPDPPLDVHLEGMFLVHHDGTQVKLTFQQHRFLTLLFENLDQAVTKQQFKEAGLKYPVQLKSKLLKKLTPRQITLDIWVKDGRFTLYSRI